MMGHGHHGTEDLVSRGNISVYFGRKFPESLRSIVKVRIVVCV